MRGESGAWHVLAHLQAVSVRDGDVVAAGQQIGEVSRLRHVHWEVLSDSRPGPGRAVVEISRDPIAWLNGMERPYDGRAPERPGDDLRTPEAHRARPTKAGTPPPAENQLEPDEAHRGS